MVTLNDGRLIMSLTRSWIPCESHGMKKICRSSGITRIQSQAAFIVAQVSVLQLLMFRSFPFEIHTSNGETLSQYSWKSFVHDRCLQKANEQRHGPCE